jgi:hypothetical protein
MEELELRELGRISRQRAFWAMAALVLVVLVSSLGGSLAAAQTTGDAGYRDFSFAGSGSPTAEKPQSKLWFNDGSWWGSLFDASQGDFFIYRYDAANHTWVNTGTPIDGRNTSRADTLWDGTRLYVVSAINSTSYSDRNAYLYRYSYDAATKSYSLDPNFPVTVASGLMESIVLDKDTTGKLWVTYAQGGKVYVNNSQDSDSSWGTPVVPRVKGASNLKPDDISSVIAFDGQIGLMWSNQTDDAIYFATRIDGDPNNRWQESRTAIMGPKSTDDHINLKSVQADSKGRVFAAVKTSYNDGSNANPNQPLIYLLERDTLGNWISYAFGRVQDDHTRPIVLIDEENRNVYMFATAPVSAGVIYYKKTSMDNISFEDQVGLGTPFIKSSTDTTINNATSTKQSVNSKTDLLVLAGDDTTKYYLHNTIDIPAGVSSPDAPDTTIDSGPSGTVTTASASFTFSSSEDSLLEGGLLGTFECSLDGGPYGACASPKEYTNLSDGTHTFFVRAIDVDGNIDPTPASRSWMVDATAPTVGSVSPADGATNVAPTSTVEAVFSEAMDPSTLNTDTFTLTKQGSTTPVVATVSYDPDTNKATLDPNDDLLEASATYTATVKGGSEGAKDTAGNPLASDKAWSFTLGTDFNAPTAQAPEEHFVINQSLGTNNIPLQISWSATDTEGPIAEYQLQQSSNGGAFSNVALSSVTSTTENLFLVPGRNYQYRVRAKDEVGNWSEWAYGQTFVVDPSQETSSAIAYGGAWTPESLSGAYGGAVNYSTVAGDTATFTFTGREVAWVSSQLADRGKAQVWIDGQKAADVDTYSKKDRWRRIVFSKSWATSGTHTLEVRVSGTAGRPRVDVDAFVVIR